MKQVREHYIRKYTTETKVEGRKVVVFVFGCNPCAIYGKMFKTRAARDKAAEEHALSKP